MNEKLDGPVPAQRPVEIMSHITGEPPRLWGSVVGFGAARMKEGRSTCEYCGPGKRPPHC